MILFKLRVTPAPNSTKRTESVVYAVFNSTDVAHTSRQVVKFLQDEGWQCIEGLGAHELLERELDEHEPLVADLYHAAEKHGAALCVDVPDAKVLMKYC